MFTKNQVNVVKLTKNPRNVRGKSCRGKLLIVNLMFGAMPVVSGVMHVHPTVNMTRVTSSL